MTQLTSCDSNATVELVFVSDHALITYRSAAKMMHDKFLSIKTQMNEKIIFRSNYISTKVSDSEILKPHTVQSTKPEKSLTQYWTSENGWKIFQRIEGTIFNAKLRHCQGPSEVVCGWPPSLQSHPQLRILGALHRTVHCRRMRCNCIWYSMHCAFGTLMQLAPEYVALHFVV